MTKPTIAYVCQFFPYMTETFVYREVCALREKGYNVVTLSNRTPDPSKLAEESKPLMADTSYVFPIQKGPFVKAHLYWLLRHPIRYIMTFLVVMLQKDESWGNIRRTIGHWAGGVFLAKSAKDQGVEHIHAHFSVNAATIGLVISRLLKVGYSFTVHNNIFTDRLILKAKLRHAKFIVSISEFSRDWLIDYAPEQTNLKSKFHIVHCGISPERFSPKPYLNGATPTDYVPRIFSLAYHAERKGMPYLVEACRILRDRGVTFECVIGGSGPQSAELKRMVRNYNLEQHVNMPGVIFQEQLDPYLNSADIFILACVVAQNGDIDGIPVVLMESMAKQVPSISTTVSGIPELIQDGETGLLVPEKDPEALADAIQKLLQNPTHAHTLAIAGRNKVTAEFNIDVTSAQLVGLFDKYVA